MFETAGLALTVFDVSDPTLEVHPKVNAFLFDVLGRVIATHSPAYSFLRGTHGDRDGRRAIVDLAKGCVEVGVRESRQDEHSALRYPAGVDPRPILATEARLVRENKARDWRPDEETRKASLLQRLDFDFYKSIRDKYQCSTEEPCSGDSGRAVARGGGALGGLGEAFWDLAAG
ncbi:hypothetical protein CYMTET_40410 [Cymbomonas tetramitiformis]|uniref:Uncharacterized protein n=1 Tax=Cymbomonas tetramitiformis TaxID=36881 RepID=A0AAE0C9Y2_9CHLO|nr:hypothetical protein CYMTET_40410 [Cymbomonas tetramitiformis]